MVSTPYIWAINKKILPANFNFVQFLFNLSTFLL